MPVGDWVIYQDLSSTCCRGLAIELPGIGSISVPWRGSRLWCWLVLAGTDRANAAGVHVLVTSAARMAGKSLIVARVCLGWQGLTPLVSVGGKGLCCEA